MNALPLPQDVRSRNIGLVPLAPCPLHICDCQVGRPPMGLAGHGEADSRGGKRMQTIRLTDQFKNLLAVARQITESAEAEAILLLLEGPTEWSRLKGLLGQGKNRGGG